MGDRGRSWELVGARNIGERASAHQLGSFETSVPLSKPKRT